jgi:hypothetical protein
MMGRRVQGCIPIVLSGPEDRLAGLVELEFE